MRHRILTCLVLACTGLAAGEADLVLHHAYDEAAGVGVAADASGNGHSGILSAGSAFAPGTGRIGGALQVDASGPAQWSAHINFQPPASAIPAGYAADLGAAFGPRGELAFGWNVPLDQYRQRSSATAPDQRYATLTHVRHRSAWSPPHRVWEIAVPRAGLYELHVVCGDPSYSDQINTLAIEGMIVTDPDGYDHFDEYRLMVLVQDGRLTIAEGPAADNPKLCFVDITQRPSANVGMVVAASPLIDAATVTQRTVALFVRADAPQLSSRKQVVYEEGDSHRGLGLYLDAGRLRAGGWNRPGTESRWRGSWMDVPVPEDGAWHHVALSLDGGPTISAGALRLYVDGVEVATAAGSQLWPHVGGLGIGSMTGGTRFHDGAAGGAGHGFSGAIDDLRIYARALDASEIATLASGNVPPPPPAPQGDPRLRQGVADAVGSDWQPLVFGASYQRPVVIATPAYAAGAAAAVVRVRNVDSSGCDIRVQNPSGAALADYRVHWLVVESGIYSAASSGITLEAEVVTISGANHSRSWNRGLERPYRQAYTQPVVLGQVMSSNDPRWSSFWASGRHAKRPPEATALTLGIQVGEDPVTAREPEQVGYLVIEAGSGLLADGRRWSAAVSGNSVAGVGDAPPYHLPLGLGFTGLNLFEQILFFNQATTASVVASPAGMDDRDGGWPVLWGAQALRPATDQVAFAFDEDQLSDSERTHSTEQVGYLVVGPASLKR